ncbi:hypothetical protein PAECIP111893_04629 [Paenibacillus plantiphilus]|uniref:Chemotaxis methyl-accepting receptor HlyB-like 4HB MCP domain-containing protein n=1 Tax=Paenibacillus plantiphilus TaxID=2905650 RepID=A0ABM9CPT2_9BACL|nr:hypothetical protein [Paenibacillus plantiphilus]CAH1220854.1 hypothetical protein PAECIP111893_04629 [Paenibacillus plantiphilus]
MEQKQPRRSWFAPIMLVLLTFSLMGNVFLYSQSIHEKQDVRVQRGFTIIESGNNAKQHIDSVLNNVRLMLDNDTIPTRLLAKSSLILAFKNEKDLVTFIEEAEVSSSEPFTFADRTAETYMSQVEASLIEVANHEGPLTEADRNYLSLIEGQYAQMQAIIANFDLSTISRGTALTIQAGGKWVTMGKNLLEIMNEPDDVSFKKP